MGHLEGRFGDGVIADAAGVDECFVRQVHQVVDDQAIIAGRVDRATIARPIGIMIPMQVGHQRGIGQRRIPRPDPDEAMTLNGGEGAHGGGWVYRFLRGHERASPARVIADAVILALHLVAAQHAHRKRQKAMPAGVLQRDGVAVLRPIEHHLDATDRARQQLPLQLAIPGEAIPRIERKGSLRRHLFLHHRAKPRPI